MCHAGYTGQNCENKYIPCDPSPCLNDGECLEVDTLSYKCQCPTGEFHITIINGTLLIVVIFGTAFVMYEMLACLLNDR
jgi:UDP:flavonoid glycosyltransferase YjiC (YdhE family)